MNLSKGRKLYMAYLARISSSTPFLDLAEASVSQSEYVLFRLLDRTRINGTRSLPSGYETWLCCTIFGGPEVPEVK